MQLSHFVRHDGTARLERTDSPTSRRPTGGRGHPVASPPVAQRTILTLEDDIDGGPADTTVRFALDDVTYELDLNCTNADELMKFLAPCIAAAWRVGQRERAKWQQSQRSARDYDAAAVRAWAACNGIDVSQRGRIPRTVLEAFTAAGK